MKTTSHSLMAKGIMVLLSLLILVFIFTYSWYLSPETPAVASGLSMNTSAAIDFDIALGFETTETGHYVVSDFSNVGFDFTRLHVNSTLSSGNVSVNNGVNTNYFNLLEHFSPVDLTGNGTELVRPYMLLKNRGIDTSKTSVMTDIRDNVEYISFDIIVRSTSPRYKISVVDGSYVISAAEAYYGGDKTVPNSRTILEDSPGNLALSDAIAADTTKSKLTADNIDADLLNTSPIARRSSYGNSDLLRGFSEDSVVGAVRVGFTKYNAPEVGSDYTADEFFGLASSGALTAKNSESHAAAPELLWIPRNDIYLQASYSSLTGDENSDNWVLHDSNDADWDNSTVSDTRDFYDYAGNGKTIPHELVNLQRMMTYDKAAAEHVYYDRDKINNVNVEARYTRMNSDRNSANYQANVVAGQTLTANKKAVIEPIFSDGQYYYGKCHVNLWIEGCDAEARRAVDGGLFFFGFKLESVV